MLREDIYERYMDALLRGDRKGCRSVIESTLQSGVPAISVHVDLIWSVMVEIERLVRSDKITTIQEHLATRINRTIVDQLQNKLPQRPRKSKRIAICCAAEELQELGAQMTADLFESEGWDVRFLGGGLTNDDILAFTHEYAPDILLIYGTAPKQAPALRKLIDIIRSVNAWPNLRIMVSGGLFNRAEGLWEEIGADAFAATGIEALRIVTNPQPIPRCENRTVNRRRKGHNQDLHTQAPELAIP